MHRVKSKQGFWLMVLLVAIAFAVSQFYLQRAYRGQLEAHYRRAFREFAFHVDGVEAELAKLQVATAEQRAMALAHIWRLVYVAQSNLGQLPVSGLNLSRIEHLLARVQNEAWKLAVDPQSVDASEIDDVYQQVRYLNGELQQMIASTEQRSSWTQWQRYFQASVVRSSNVIPGERNPLMQSLVMVEDGMDRFPTSDVAAELARLGSPEFLGEAISSTDAIHSAREFLADLGEGRQFHLVNVSEGALPTFTVEALGEKDSYIVEVAEAGGIILWLANPRRAMQENLSVEEGAVLAEQFLKARDFGVLENVGWEVFQNRVVFTHVPLERNVLIFPQYLKTQVNLDDGQIVGLQSLAFHGFRQPRELVPTISEDAARALLGDKDVVEQRLTVILNSLYQEVLAYQFRVNRGPEQFLVYINAHNGQEEQVRRVPAGTIVRR